MYRSVTYMYKVAVVGVQGIDPYVRTILFPAEPFKGSCFPDPLIPLKYSTPATSP